MKKSKIFAAIAASLLLSGLTDLKAQWTNTGTTESTTNNVGIGLTAPTANLHISGTSSQPLLNTTLNGISNDFLRIQNGTANTTTYIPTIWGNNAEGYTGFEVVGSTSSANDISGYPPVININGRRYDGTGSGSPLLNRTLFEVSNYTVPLLTIGATGNTNINGGLTVTNSGIPLVGVTNGTATAYIGVSSAPGALAGPAIANDAVFYSMGGNTIVASQAPGTSIKFATTAPTSNYWSQSRMEINSIGQVGIGMAPCSTSTGLLQVNGQIEATSIKVELVSSTNGVLSFPDYVFAKDYKLKSLGDLEKFISENNHLPGIPSASEVEKDGINVAEMDVKLLEKIEEITLYIIEMKKEINTLQKENTQLKNKSVK